MSKKVILKLQLLDKEAEKNAVEKVRGLQGFNEFFKDMKYENKEKDQKWIVIGDIDPVDLAIKLGEFCSIKPELVTVTEQEPENSSKEKKAMPEKGQEPKKDEKQKETKKEERAKKDEKQKETKKEEPEEKEERAKKDKKQKETKKEEPEEKEERAKKNEKRKETKKEVPEEKEEQAKKNEQPKNDDVAKLVSAYKAYNPYKNE